MRWLGTLIVTVATLAMTPACTTAPQAPLVHPSYDTYTGRLVQLEADQDGDGIIDQWTYVDGTRPLRGEKDDNADGRIDRWEYFDGDAELSMVGTSSRGDGIEDTWTYVRLVDGAGRLDKSTARDRHIDRHEFYVNQALARVELDTNGDGRVDRWDQYENKVLREVKFDTSFSAGRPDRRLIYGPDGHFVAAQADDDGDGRFEPIAAGAKVVPPGEPVK